MKRVTGIGGIFLKCRDVDAMRTWYSTHLGIAMETWGAQFNWKDEEHPAPYSAFSFFPKNSDYFAPSESAFMINFRVDDLDALVKQLQAEGVSVVSDPVEEEYGKFAWVLDPEGNKIELWEQPK